MQLSVVTMTTAFPTLLRFTSVCRVWSGSRVLADFLVSNQQYVEGIRTIELGAGTGTLSSRRIANPAYEDLAQESTTVMFSWHLELKVVAFAFSLPEP
jgi:predicted nicotinamide N-methyase